jgi:hypothetical protein
LQYLNSASIEVCLWNLQAKRTFPENGKGAQRNRCGPLNIYHLPFSTGHRSIPPTERAEQALTPPKSSQTTTRQYFMKQIRHRTSPQKRSILFSCAQCLFSKSEAPINNRQPTRPAAESSRAETQNGSTSLTAGEERRTNGGAGSMKRSVRRSSPQATLNFECG